MAPRQRTTNNSSSTAANGSSHQSGQTTMSGAIASTQQTPKGPRTQAKHSQFDFNSMSVQMLRKYRQTFKLSVKARSSKEDLVMAITRHFSNYMVDEVDTIARFLYTVHSNKEGKPSFSLI
ncbi:hypothetical protein GGI25_006129 [Coemansia spiralis]|uniref:Histone deacetylase complex subunit SAP30 Sin3 binding domain-containing protein n=2 Tax=Coemansia TaxID=4863 RepID=A0A9W8KVT3_9FUNG|nr:Sin3 binding region of histone deacetylase complex subunit SAP30-domain-containing protein [Coemansia spiralis]KAJ1986898.1 hypothetical protein EDC05_006107 [Coemansia umbellata]KAJ2618939.1 hypothetical protein GGI26_006224 [Coemansia sp. RSA 1358]KAJ2669482.1 hypothetical protein GGI25_006129 [Coemansia spiralis]